MPTVSQSISLRSPDRGRKAEEPPLKETQAQGHSEGDPSGEDAAAHSHVESRQQSG